MPEAREEALAAAAWWAGALAAEPGLDAERVAVFERVLAGRVEALCQDAGWQPEVPTYGTCGRQVSNSPRPDGVLARAGREAGVSGILDRLPPAVMWVNPGEVLVQAAADDEPAQVWPAPR
jgi:BTG family